MENIEQIYEQLTGVNIEEQCRMWDERGRGYYGEYCVFEKLFHGVRGHCKLLMNLNLPTRKGGTTEVDLLMIHESGIYVFEIKHYKGVIYGNTNDPTWTQYFRTTENHVFKNPVLQNKYHIEVLTTLLPNTPIYSVIVFTNENCDIRVQNNNPNIVITTLRNLSSALTSFPVWRQGMYDMQLIDAMFKYLSPYSPLSKATVSVGPQEVVSFYSYLDLLTNKNATVRQQMEEERTRMQEQQKINKRTFIFTTIASLLCATLVCSLVIGSFKKDFEEKSAIAQQEVEQVKEIAEQYRNYYQEKEMLLMKETEQMKEDFGDLTKCFGNEISFVQVSKVQLKKSIAYKNTAAFSCSLTNVNEKFGILLTEQTEYVIEMNDGTTQRIAMFGDRLRYYEESNRLYSTGSNKGKHSGDLATLNIPNIEDKNDICRIKITGISVWKFNGSAKEVFAEGVELELYTSAQ